MADKKTMEIDDNELEKAAGGVGYPVKITGKDPIVSTFGAGNEETPLGAKAKISSVKQTVSVDGTDLSEINGKPRTIIVTGTDKNTDAV